MRCFSRLLLLLLFGVPSILACPLAVSSLCRCEELHNGVALNCSDSDGATVVEALKSHQALLGLIQNLVMHRANVASVPASFFASLFIKRLDLSHNRISHLDPNAFSGMSPVLQELSLTHNNLSAIPAEALKQLKTLLKLDLSNNTIGDIEAEEALPSLPKLYDLNLAYNNICSVHKNAFVGIRDNVQTINLGHNCLSAVPAPAIRGFKQLMSLHMHANELTTLDALSFMNLPVVNLLNLASNKITEIKPQAFLNVPNLRYLYLTENHISSLAAQQFTGFEQLEMLDLTNNYIDVIPKSAFSGLTQLRQLYLGSNRISHIEPDAFANSSISILILAANNLSSIDDGILNGLPHLQQLSLKDNKIAKVHQNAFYNAPSVAMVDMSGNLLAELPPSTFLTQLNLLLIDLSRNLFTKTPYAAFNRRIGTVLLQENPLVCTEKVHMLQDGIGVYIPSSDDVICGGKPKTSSTTTTSTTPSAPAFQQIDGSNGEAPNAIETFLKQQPQTENSNQAMVAVGTEVVDENDGEEDREAIQPVRPVNAPENSRPSILNMRPTNIVSRPRSRFVSDISARLPVREIVRPRTLVATQPPAAVPVEQSVPEAALPAEVEESAAEGPALPLPDHSPGLIGEDLGPADEEALLKALANIPIAPPPTPAPSEPTVTDIADNPRIIHPFPVPFLKRGPVLSSSSRIRTSSPSTASLPSTTTLFPLEPDQVFSGMQAVPAEIEAERVMEEAENFVRQNIGPIPSTSTMAAPPPPANQPKAPPVLPSHHTLPPSIVLAPIRPATPPPVTAVDSNRVDETFTEFALQTQAPDEISLRGNGKVKESKAIGLTTVVLVVVAVVSVCAVTVFVSLCFFRHRQMRRLGGSSSSGSTTARTNAYVAAHQAQMGIYGSVSRSRSMSISRPDDTPQPWIYSPSTYSTYYNNK